VPTAITPHPFLAAVRDAAVWRRAARLGFVVGVLQVALNQGDHWLHREVDVAVVAKTILSPLLSFAIAFASAVATRAETIRGSAQPSSS
jgi:hypothetical protein